MRPKDERRQVTIIDLQIQNILSVENAFRTVGADVCIARNVGEADGTTFMVLPGVGAFGTAIARLEETGLADAVRRHALDLRLPLLGLCLGMQLLADSSEEFGANRGLGLIPGKVERLREKPPDDRVPNMGWREVRLTPHSSLLPNAADGRSYYHVHSFHLRCADTRDVVGQSNFGGEAIASMVHRDNIFGTQFHPEKSQDAGLDLLSVLLQALR